MIRRARQIEKDERFAVLFEAKVLSDCDSEVSFDVMRNQLARNIDVMLDATPACNSHCRG